MARGRRRPACSRCAASSWCRGCCSRSAAAAAWRCSASALARGLSRRPRSPCCRSGCPTCRSTCASTPVGVLPDAARRAAAGVSAFAAGYFGAARARRPGCSACSTTCSSPAWRCVLLADDAYAFMVTWETMALSSFFLVTTNHRIAEIRRAGFLYLLIAHVGAIAILLCFGVLQADTGDYTFANMRAQQLVAVLGARSRSCSRCSASAPRPGIAAAARLAARSASGGAVAGLGADERRDAEDRDLRPAARRRSTCCTPQLWWWGVRRCSRSGSSTALFGVVFAAVQIDMKRLLAYSSIENIGLIVAGIGLAIAVLGLRHAAAGGAGADRGALPRRSTTRSSRACCSSAPARCCTRPASAASASSAG